MIKKRTRPQTRKRESSLEALEVPEVEEEEGDEKLPYVLAQASPGITVS